MKYTNRLNLPEPIVRAISVDEYTRGTADISVSSLPLPPRLAALVEAHGDTLEEDVADRIWLLFGTLMHEMLKRAGTALIVEELVHVADGALGPFPPERVVEERLYTECLGWKISGAFDHVVYQPDGTLDDYKVSSTWSVKDDGKEEWRAQLNLYALLLRRQGKPVTRLRNIVFCRDWRKNEALKYASSNYPAHQVAIVDVPLWSDAEQDRYLDARVRLHQAARTAVAAGTGIPHCTPEERWQKAPVWAVVKDGNTRATKLCASEDEAKAVIGTAPKLHIEFRPGLAVRCQQYCAVRAICEGLLDGQHQTGELGSEEDGA